MRVQNRKQFSQAEEVAASTATSANEQAMGVAFWPSVGVGVFTGGLVWLLHRTLNHFFPPKRHAGA